MPVFPEKFDDFWERLSRKMEEDRLRGGEIFPVGMVDLIKKCSMDRGVDVRVTEIDGSGMALVTLLDKSDGLPIEEHGGPPRFKRPEPSQSNIVPEEIYEDLKEFFGMD